MKVRVRGGYMVSVNGVVYRSKQEFDISEADYKATHWIFEVVTGETPAVEKSEPEVVVGAVAAEDVLNTAMASPIIRRGRTGRGRK